jgi:hypothetical protein
MSSRITVEVLRQGAQSRDSAAQHPENGVLRVAVEMKQDNRGLCVVSDALEQRRADACHF